MSLLPEVKAMQPVDNPEAARYYIPQHDGPYGSGYGQPVLRFIERDGDDYWVGTYSRPEDDADWNQPPGTVYSAILKHRISKMVYEFALDLINARIIT